MATTVATAGCNRTAAMTTEISDATVIFAENVSSGVITTATSAVSNGSQTNAVSKRSAVVSAGNGNTQDLRSTLDSVDDLIAANIVERQ